MYSPYDQYNAEIERLIRQGCSNQIVQQQLLSKYPQLMTQAAQVLKYIQAVEREIRSSGR